MQCRGALRGHRCVGPRRGLPTPAARMFAQVGVTAFQMDIKVEGITLEIMRVALERARVGRKHILGEMLKSKRGPRGALSPFAPRMARLVIPKEKIGALIVPQGKVVRAIQAAMGATVTVDSDSGSVDILTPNEGSLARTREVIQAIVAEVRAARGAARAWGTRSRDGCGTVRSCRSILPQPEKGKLYRGCVVTGLAAFGAFVEILPGKTGLVHISELDVNGVKEVSDAVKVGTRAGMRRGSCCEPSRTRAPWPRPAGGRRRRRDAPGHDGQRQDEAEQARGADIPKGFARGQVA